MTYRWLAALALGLGGLAAPALALEPFQPSVPALRSCAQYGPGFIAVPGTETCTRISGRVTAEAGTATRSVRREDIAGFGTSGRVAVDSRTATPYGPLRAYLRVRVGDGTIRP